MAIISDLSRVIKVSFNMKRNNDDDNQVATVQMKKDVLCKITFSISTLKNLFVLSHIFFIFEQGKTKIFKLFQKQDKAGSAQLAINSSIDPIQKLNYPNLSVSFNAFNGQ